MPPVAATAVQPAVDPATSLPDDSARWAPPTSRQPVPAPPPYGGGWDDEVPEGHWDDDEGWEDHEPVQREGDPRIGLPMRTGLLASAAVAWVGALMAWPGMALVAIAVLSALARATDRSVTALVLRRYDYGRRRSDVPFAVASSPWHLVVGAVATVVGLVLPVAVALAGVFATALMLAGTQGGDLGPGSPATLAVGGAIGLLMLWWGPGGASLRRGSRSMARTLVPAGVVAQVVPAVLVVFGAVAALTALRHGVSFTWNPFSASPFGR
jgi:hypothetical protein